MSAIGGGSGQRLKATAPLVEFNLRFPGQYFDAESNLTYNGFRSYQASQGRYAQFDPIGLAGGINGYAYADNTPLSRTDALGLQATIPMPGPGGLPLPLPLPLPIPSPAPGKGGSSYDPRTDSWTPGRTISIPNWWRSLFKTVLDQCEEDCEKEKEERDALCFIAQAMGGKAAQRECLSRSDAIAYQCRKKCKEDNCKP